MADQPRYYITTAIAYPNGPPHIGHAYEAIATDAIARFMRLDGYDVLFLTGTDEHGIKMLQTAGKEKLSPSELVERNVPRFKAMVERLECSNDEFIRTTERRHHAASMAIWQKMEANGDIYLDKYSGWYSVRDEAYYADAETTVSAEGERRGPTGSPVEWVEEESYFFRLSRYQEKLLDLYREHPDFVLPETRMNEVTSFVKGGLQDLSVSRTNFDWGIPVPGDPKHVMYVWVDALTNYLTGAGYPGDADMLARFWPADLHLIGKDITRFHTVYWPAFLMSADLPLPKQVFAHGFVLHRGEKMSKSVGNVVSPDGLTQAFGIDAVRYFLLREVSFGQDGSYSAEAIVARVNAELANSFGNLAQRTLSMIYKNLDGVLPAAGDAAADRELLALVDDATTREVPEAFDRFAFSIGIEAWLRAVFACNAYVDTQAPWALRKTDPQRMAAVLGTLVIAVRELAQVIAPIIPTSADKLLTVMDAGEGGAPIAQPAPLFPRLELEEETETAA